MIYQQVQFLQETRHESSIFYSLRGYFTGVCFHLSPADEAHPQRIKKRRRRNRLQLLQRKVFPLQPLR